MNKLKFLAVLGLSVGVLSAQALPGTDTQVSDKHALAEVSGLELPSRTAHLIAAATRQEQSAVTVREIEAAVTMNPSAAPAIVSAVAARVPRVAALAAATAVKLQPRQAAMIAEVATKAASAQAAAIVTACSIEQPSQYAALAVAAYKAAPAARREILIAASEFSPAAISPYLVGSANGSSLMPVDVSIARAYAAQASASQSLGNSALPKETDLQIPADYLKVAVISTPWTGKARTHSGLPIQ